MGQGAVIGPSTPIVVGGTPIEQNHAEGVALSLIVSLAERWGRNATAASIMVLDDQAYSASQAYNYNLTNGFAGSLSDALNAFGLKGTPYVLIGENVYEQLLSAVSNPELSGILILLGVLALALDFYHPTIVLTIVGVIGIVAGLIGIEVIGASTLGFLVLVIAAALIFLELKLGHGLAIMGGMILGVIGIYLLAQGLNYSPSPLSGLAEVGLLALGAVGILAGLYIRWIIAPLRRRRSVRGPESLIGKIGIVTTPLSPAGEVRIEGIIWHARSVSGTIDAGERVKVVTRDNLILIVEKEEDANR
jgi:membrane-bound serine protease (ClpP class)